MIPLSEVRRDRWAGSMACVLAVLGLVWVVTLVGCGSDAGGTGGAQTAVQSGDVCLFAGEVPADKTPRPDATREGGDEKVTLPVDGSWHADSVTEGAWERHRFETRKNITYLVELDASNNTKDDPDLDISREPDPYNNWWRGSYYGTGYPDLVVFRADRDGVMYIAVSGFDSLDDGTVDYNIRVRKARQGLNTG